MYLYKHSTCLVELLATCETIEHVILDNAEALLRTDMMCLVQKSLMYKLCGDNALSHAVVRKKTLSINAKSHCNLVEELLRNKVCAPSSACFPCIQVLYLFS